MAKKKSNSQKSAENDLRKLYDHIDNQKFENIEALQAFLNQMVGKKIDDIIPDKKGQINPKEQSRDLVSKAYETSIEKGKSLVEKALKLDPDNAEAYNYLASIEQDANKAIEYFEKGMLAGKKEIGEKEFNELKGSFWGAHQTRPFMRAKAGYAECLYWAGRVEESIAQYLEMIALNPGDNQGIRYQLSVILINHNQFAEYEQLRKLYINDSSALWLFNYAIYLFKKQGNSLKAQKALGDAHASNNHVIAFLAGEIELPDAMPDYYGLGDKNEAVVYLQYAIPLWIETKGALLWVNEFYEKRKKFH